MKNTNKYDDIINLDHHKSSKRAPMPIINRAAQFAPFAALTGYDAAVRETARLTNKKIELDNYAKEEINRRLMVLFEHKDEGIIAIITYFVPDKRKSGGEYVTYEGCIVKIDEYENIVITDDGTQISVQDIFSIESDIFNDFD